MRRCSLADGCGLLIVVLAAACDGGDEDDGEPSPTSTVWRAHHDRPSLSFEGPVASTSRPTAPSTTRAPVPLTIRSPPVRRHPLLPHGPAL